MAARLYFESDQTTNTLSNILMMMTSEPANPLPCSFCSWIVSVKMRPLSFSPYLSHWCQKKYKNMKVEPDKKLLFIPFSSYRVVYHSENNQCGCYFKIPVDISLSDKDTRWCSFFVDDNKKNKQPYIWSIYNKMDDTESKVAWRTMISLEVLAKVTASRWDHLFLPWCIAGQ